MAKLKNIADIRPDVKNANKGTHRGRGMVESSLRETGAGRSIVVDKAGRVIAGNKTLEAWADIANPDDVVIVPTDGKKLVVVQRQDLDLSDDAGLARKLAFYDNRAGQVGLEWDIEELSASMQNGLDLSPFWTAEELDTLLAAFSVADWGAAMGGLPTEDRAPFQQMTFTLHDSQAEQVRRAIAIAATMGDFADSLNQNGNGNALALICETFITDYGNG